MSAAAIAGGMSSGLSNLFIGLSGVNEGTQIQVAGANMAASAFELQGYGSIEAASYNVELDQFKTDRMLSSVNRQFAQLIGTQRTQVAASGLRSSSQSFLAVANETLDALTKESLRIQEDATQRQEAIMFQGSSGLVSALNQSEAAKYQGRIAEYQAGVTKAKAIGSAIGSMGSMAASGMSKGGGK